MGGKKNKKSATKSTPVQNNEQKNDTASIDDNQSVEEEIVEVPRVLSPGERKLLRQQEKEAKEEEERKAKQTPSKTPDKSSNKKNKTPKNKTAQSQSDNLTKNVSPLKHIQSENTDDQSASSTSKIVEDTASKSFEVEPNFKKIRSNSKTNKRQGEGNFDYWDNTETNLEKNISELKVEDTEKKRYNKNDTYYDAKQNNWRSSKREFEGYNRHSYENTYKPHYTKYSGRDNKEYQAFLKLTRSSKPIDYGKISEIHGDLFTAPEEYSLAHCVAEDMSMGAGVARTFKSEFGQVAFLMNQHQKTGGLAVLEHKDRYIYYLVTKEYSRGKPTLYTLWLSLQRLKEHCMENKVEKLAIPQIGCGLDRLIWSDVQQMLEFIFQDVDIEILVYIYDETLPTDKPTEKPTDKPTRKLHTKCPVVHKVLPLIDIEPLTGLLYFASEDGSITEQMQHLSQKFNILPNFKSSSKKIGEVLRVGDKGELIYGLIIRKTQNDQVDFYEVEKTLRNLQKLVRKDEYEYVGFQAFIDSNDPILIEKIISLMQYILRDVAIWVCWPNELSHLCPYKDEPRTEQTRY